MGHVPRKRFGQNFLTDTDVISQIVQAIRPRPHDRVVEIGPGLGALTAPLLARVDHLHVVEIDRDLVARLARAFPADRLTIHQGDVLDFDFAALGTDLRIVGNLPYNISTPLLFRLAQFAAHVRDMHFMLQKEVVARMVARPATSAYGRLSVMLQRRFAIEKILDVPAAAFRPAPKVESAVVRMIPAAGAAGAEAGEPLLSEVVTAAFSQRRKTLRNALGRYFEPADFSALGLDPGARPQDLTVDDFARAAAYLERKKR